jgi:hypothetical protein
MAKRDASLQQLSHQHYHVLALRLPQASRAVLSDEWTHDHAEQRPLLVRFFGEERWKRFFAEEQGLLPLAINNAPRRGPRVSLRWSTMHFRGGRAVEIELNINDLLGTTPENTRAADVQRDVMRTLEAAREGLGREATRR